MKKIFISSKDQIIDKIKKFLDDYLYNDMDAQIIIEILDDGKF